MDERERMKRKEQLEDERFHLLMNDLREHKSGTPGRKKVQNKISEIEEALIELETPEERRERQKRLLEQQKREIERKAELKKTQEERAKRWAEFIPEIIPARTCLSCKYNDHKRKTYTDKNGKRQKLTGSYIVCKLQNGGYRIWKKLHCMKWRMTRSKPRRAYLLKMVPVDELKPRETDIHGKEYDDPDVPIRLGKSCFTCKFRQGNVIRRHVTCTRHNRPVWEYAYCVWYKPVTEYNTIIQFKKFIEKGSGLDFMETVGWDK